MDLQLWMGQGHVSRQTLKHVNIRRRQVNPHLPTRSFHPFLELRALEFAVGGSKYESQQRRTGLAPIRPVLPR